MQKAAETQTVRETKRRIRVNYEGKLSLKERLTLKLRTGSFWIDKVWLIFRFIMMLGISFVIIQPFVGKIFQSFMAIQDFTDLTVSMIPKNLSVDIYKYLVTENHYFKALGNTALLSLICAVLQTFTCCMVGYGISKFKFRGRKIILLMVIITMVVPHSTLRLAMLQHFISFDPGVVMSWGYKGIIQLITGTGLNLINTHWPLVILSIIGCGFKNGLYIFMMIQFFKGIPDELEESAYVDGSGSFRTFVRIILPNSIPMMITIFLFAFSWQWTDEFYTGLFYSGANKMALLPDIYKVMPPSLVSLQPGHELYESAVRNTAGMMIIAPLIIVYLFGQRYLVEGIERAGLVG